MDAKSRETYSANVFHGPPSAASRPDDTEAQTTSLANLLTDLITSWKSFDGAGSRFLYTLCGSLAGSQYEGVSRDLVAVLGPMFGCGESELVLGHLRKMEGLLCGMQAGPAAAGNQEKQAEPKELLLCQCLLQFLKLQSEYHHMCSNTVNSVISHVVATGNTHAHPDLTQQLRSLDLSQQTHTQSPSRHLPAHKKGQVNVGSPRTQKHGFKASLFSLFERKNSPDEGNSSFYVDLGQGEGGAGEGVVGGVDGGHVTDSSQSQMLVQLGLDPGVQEDGAVMLGTAGMGDNMQGARLLRPASDHAAKANGEVATQEELDSVINLLSGLAPSGPAPSHTMQTIPEGHDPAMLLHVPSGSQASSLSPATSDSCVNDRLHAVNARVKGQRRSEGSIDLSGFGAVPGTNTWPYQHRSSLPGGQLAPYSQVLYDFNTPPPTLAGYNSNNNNNSSSGAGGMEAHRPTTLPPGGAGHFQGGYNWGFPDPRLNRAWPVTNLAGTGSVTDTINSSWSGAQDSDDLSDDSSSCDQFHNVHHLQMANQGKMRDDSSAGVKRDERVGEVKHHSLEDLLDGRSNTWPQQPQPWSQSQRDLDLDLDLVDPRWDRAAGLPHRPLQMQLSDPLSRKNVWPNSGDPASQQLPQLPNVQNIQNVPNIQNAQNVQNVQSVQNMQTVPNVQNVQGVRPL